MLLNIFLYTSRFIFSGFLFHKGRPSLENKVHYQIFHLVIADIGLNPSSHPSVSFCSVIDSGFTHPFLWMWEVGSVG